MLNAEERELWWTENDMRKRGEKGSDVLLFLLLHPQSAYSRVGSVQRCLLLFFFTGRG